jgi:uncharacterized protein YndB with AHSA1/START domain
MKTIHHLVDIDSGPTAVWNALTVASSMSEWWSTSVKAGAPAVGELTYWTFSGDFNPVMEITVIEPFERLEWRCVGGHEPWQDGTFRFLLEALDDGRTRLRFWQDYAVELSDDAYGVYNFNWGYYLESLRLLCSTGRGKPYLAP